MENTQTQITENQAVNLDLLAAPDNGSLMQHADLDTRIAGLPNLDEHVDTEFQTQTHEPNTQQTQQSDNVFQSKYLDIVKKKYEDHGFEMPNDVTEENFLDKIDELYSSRVNNSQLHPEVEKFNQAVQQGVNPTEYLKTLRGIDEVLEMPADTLVRTSLEQNFGKSDRRPNGWTEEKIESTIQKMENSGLLEIEAEKIRTSYEQNKQTAADNMIREVQNQRTVNSAKMNELRNESIKSSMNYFSKMDNINGLPVSQSEKAEFADQFRYLVTPDDKKGVSPLLEMLQSDETLVKVAYFLSRGDAKIKEQITRSKESSKEQFLSKLDPEPKTTQSRGGMQSTEIDLDALAAPSQY